MLTFDEAQIALECRMFGEDVTVTVIGPAGVVAAFSGSLAWSSTGIDLFACEVGGSYVVLRRDAFLGAERRDEDEAVLFWQEGDVVIVFAPVFEEGEAEEEDEDAQREGDEDPRVLLAEIRAAVGLPRLRAVP